MFMISVTLIPLQTPSSFFVSFFITIFIVFFFENKKEDLKAILEICTRLKALRITEVDLLPFHRLGSSKYEAMELEYAYKNQQPLTHQEIQEIQAIYKTYFTVKLEG